MSTVVDIDQPAISPVVLDQTIRDSVAAPSPGAQLEVLFPDFGFGMSPELLEFKRDRESDSAFVKAAIGPDVRLFMTLMLELLDGGLSFRVRQFSFQVQLLHETAQANFIFSTIHALWGLSNEVQFGIPHIGLQLTLGSVLELNEISRMLQWRQAAYRLMAIERATGVAFAVPPSLSGEDLLKINLVYRAIVDRSFAWPVETYFNPVPATEEWLRGVTDAEEKTTFAFLKSDIETVLGQRIDLGQMTTTITDGFIENLDSVKRELAMADGHEVEIVVRSVSGRATLEFPEAPRFPDSEWEASIQTLIELEPRLDARHFERYDALAAATLADLTEVEKADVTARFEIGEAFFGNEEPEKHI